jgi:hypothetical protein
MTIRTAAFCRAHPTDSDCNTVNLVTVRLRRVRLYFHNESNATQPRDVVPYSTDNVKLQAVVWAKTTARGSRWQPYADRAFTNDGRYFSLGSQRPDLARPGATPSWTSWRRQRLDRRRVPRVLAWPSDWPPLTFRWEELSYTASAPDAAHARTYTYGGGPLTVPAPGWTLTQRFSPGTHRFRVTVTLPPQHYTTRRGAPRATRQFRRRSCSNRARNRGLALHLCIREANIPTARNANLTEMLRWCTAFLETPYEWGGHWFGGKATSTRDGGQNGYQGYGSDCTGLPSSAAALAGVGWSPWRRTTRTGYRPIAGRTVTDYQNVQPGDLLDRSDHVRVVYDVTRRTTNDASIRFIEASGSAGKVRITSAASVRTLASGTNPYELKRLD